jgi:hypothetical protein
MWSPSLIPKPKDWPEYVDIVGTFIDKEARMDIIQKKKLRAKQKAKEAKQQLKGNKANASESNQQKHVLHNTIAPVHNFSSSTLHSSSDNLLSDAHSNSEASLLPINNNLTYTPSPELQRFLETGKEPIIFVGFGSMVIKDLESTISLFLEAAAMMKIKLLVQMGWSQISPDRFIQLAKAAEEKGRKVKDVQLAVDLEGSMIFPSNAKPPIPTKRHSISDSNPSTLSAISSSKIPTPQDEAASRPRSKSIAADSSISKTDSKVAAAPTSQSSSASIGSWLLGWGNKLGLAPATTTNTNSADLSSNVSIIF